MPVTALQAWLRAQALLWLPALAACPQCAGPQAALPWQPVAAAAIATSFAALVLVLRSWRTVADAVTIARTAALAAVLALAPLPATAGVVAAACAVAAADLVDGALARRFGSTQEGAVLDMEADQLAVLALALLVHGGGGGVHVLLLPAMRPLFVLAAWLLGLPAHDPKPVGGDNRRGRRICAAVVTALLLALVPGLPPWLGHGATAFAVLLLAWSFAGDARFLLARRGAAKARA